MDRLKWLWERSRKIVGALVLIIAGCVLALGGLYLYNQHQHAVQDENALHSLIMIANFNIQRGKLEVPPEMQQQKPAAGPAATTPQAPKGPEPPEKP